jgi:nucleotide-binding universal stress UspA family protein
MSTLEAALFESGRPILIAPPSPQPQIGTNVLITWNCSTEQARATAFAIPVLGRGTRVVVLTVVGGAGVPGPTGEQLCRYLQLNEVPTKPLTVSLEGRLTDEVILAHAKALGCDLLIKGAYTQSRLRQIIFGGTTRYILQPHRIACANGTLNSPDSVGPLPKPASKPGARAGEQGTLTTAQRSISTRASKHAR